MDTAEIIVINGHQHVALPDDMRFASSTVSIRKQGESVVLEPTKPNSWPTGFFESIRIEDEAFCRPSQGSAPTINLDNSTG